MNNILFERRLNLPKAKLKMAKTKKHPEKRYSEVLCTLNNVGRWIKFRVTDIKNEYKSGLKEYYIPEPDAVYDSLTIDYRIIRHTNRTVDKDNIIFALKWLADTLEELGYVKNDKVVNFKSFDTIVDTRNPETMFEVRVHTNKEEW